MGPFIGNMPFPGNNPSAGNNTAFAGPSLMQEGSIPFTGPSSMVSNSFDPLADPLADIRVPSSSYASSSSREHSALLSMSKDGSSDPGTLASEFLFSGFHGEM
jgi:hypothetical protein